MNFISHLLVGLIVGTLILFQKGLVFLDILIIILFSNGIDLDHIVNLIRKKSKYHLRSFIQEPLAIAIIGIPSGLIISFILDSFIYFWLILAIYSTHVTLDYICIFETCPLAPINNKMIKPEGYGIIMPISPEWMERKKEFPKTINEIYITIFLTIIFLILVYIFII